MPPLALAGISIALWASLAYLSTLVTGVPPFLVVGAALVIGSVPGLVRARDFTRDPRALAIGVYGLFGYHFCLFIALRMAPAVEANLLNYLWPVLIVAMSPPLRWNHAAGAVLAFAGAALIATGGDFTHLTFQPGLLLALAAAIIWSSYSVLTRRLRGLSTATVSQFCLVSGALALATHVAIEPAAHLTAHDIAVLVVLGIGPMGAAFYCWDAALKGGDPRRIGALSYLTPLLSTACLVLVGGKPFTAIAAVAMALIIGGAVLGGARRAGVVTAGRTRTHSSRGTHCRVCRMHLPGLRKEEDQMPSRTDKIVSKGMETAKAVKATAKGITGVFKTLMEQHGEVSGLLRRVQNNPDKRADLWPQIRRELLSHERGELRVVFPVLREFEETRELADLHDTDATELEAQIDNLDAEGLDSTSWGEQFDILVKLVSEHVREEESDIFPLAMKVCGDELATELDSKFLEAKKSAIAAIA